MLVEDGQPPIKLFDKQLTSHKICDIKINFITLIMVIIRVVSLIWMNIHLGTDPSPNPHPDKGPSSSGFTRNKQTTSSRFVTSPPPPQSPLNLAGDEVP